MKIHIVYCYDRHQDPELFGFLKREDAIKKAREYMQDHVNRPEGLSECEVDGRFYIDYKYEADHAFVVEVEVVE